MWELWRFNMRAAPVNESQKLAQAQELPDFMKALTAHLDIKSLYLDIFLHPFFLYMFFFLIIRKEDWYRVSKSQLTAFGSSVFLKSQGGLCAALAKTYPLQAIRRGE